MALSIDEQKQLYEIEDRLLREDGHTSHLLANFGWSKNQRNAFRAAIFCAVAFFGVAAVGFWAGGTCDVIGGLMVFLGVIMCVVTLAFWEDPDRPGNLKRRPRDND